MAIEIYSISHAKFKGLVNKTYRAIVPIGSLEQHGAHLPVSTDSLISEKIATLLADKLGCFILPVITYTVSFEHQPMFNVSLKDSTLSRVLCEICVSLSGQGIKEIIFINGHHGNTGVLQYVSQNVNTSIRSGHKIFAINYWDAMHSKLDHAGEVETSLVLAIRPELVKMEKAEPNSRNLFKSRIAYSTLTTAPGSFPELTGNGVWGQPRNASKTKGNKLLREILTNLVRLISELSHQ